MASGGPVQALCDEATCPVCLEYFRDPMTITACGHNFCQGCLDQIWGEKKGDVHVSCPQCRDTTQRNNVIPNRALRNMVEIAKKLSLQDQEKDQGVERVCEEHQEPLKLFCKDHQLPICLVCDRSKEHKHHKVVPQEEAFQEYKGLICKRLVILRAARENFLTHKAETAKKSQDLLNQTKEKRQKIVAEFQLVYQFLEEQEKNLLAQIKMMEKKIARWRDEQLARVSKELTSLENLIQKMAGKCQQPTTEYQNIGKTLQSYEEEKKKVFVNFETFPPEFTSKVEGFFDVKHLLNGVMEQFPENVTLDPNTAHPDLIVSEDHKSVTYGGFKYQTLPNNPERFDSWNFVLGSEGFTSGRHFWEVTVGSGRNWAVGVARKSVKRKGRFDLTPEEGIWAMGKQIGQHRIFNGPNSTDLYLIKEFKRIRVSLNCAEGQVAFSDADTGMHLYTYSRASFCGETLFPFFWVDYEVPLRISP